MDLASKYPSLTAKILKSLRLKNELTQQLVGESFNKSRSTVSRIERGRKKLSAAKLREYLKALNSSFKQFCDLLEPLVFLEDFAASNVETSSPKKASPKEYAGKLVNREEIILSLKDYFQSVPVNEVYLFGSVARGDFDTDSDIDLYLTFAPEAKISIFDLSQMKIDLLELTGRSTDLVVKGSEYGFIKDSLQKGKVLIHG